MIPNHPTAIAAVARVAALYGIGAEHLLGRDRSATLVEARHLAWWFLRETTGWSYPEIGRALGVDHTSVLHGVRKACGKVRDGTGGKFFKDVVETLACLVELGGESSGKAEVCPPPLTLSPSDTNSPVLVLSVSGSDSALSSGSEGPESKPARGKRKRPRTDPPDTILPTDKHREIAEQKRLDLKVEIERCLNHHRAHGNTMASWNAALTTWLLSPYAKATTTPPRGVPQAGHNFERLKAQAEQLEREERNAAQ